ncbi:Gfo/Idh/MocA family oxidoreductase [Aureimonas sp. ME7]|uniref:Gfo/Idh/MocA family protein n=1 Tax=Aureimonas sp. ME7 TaxID=2744252 RepID=UPI0015F6C3AD|nr:Gfo/Idh/MocA family oxidoreductase [Aureimonas sp. ME7]
MTFPTVLPVSRVPDPRTAPRLRWGILGTGWIAERFIESVRAHTNQEIAAVGSRAAPTAKAFASAWDVPTAHASYEALVADRSLDVVYVATPHNMHLDHATLALEAGCNVLVEKPIGLSLEEAERLVGLARQKRVFFAEALWTYFLPKFDIIQQLLDADVLGEIKSVHTEYGEHFTRDHRIFDPALAGGPLLDLGTYPASFIAKLMGVPERVVGMAQDDPSGVHGQLAVVLASRAGALATMATTLYGLTPTNAAVVGTEATLRFGTEFNLPGPFELISADGRRRLLHDEPPGRHIDGLCYEAAEVARCIDGGRIETGYRSLNATLATMATMDMIRDATGIQFSSHT